MSLKNTERNIQNLGIYDRKVSEELALCIDNAGNRQKPSAKSLTGWKIALMPEVVKIMRKFKDSLVFDKLF